MVEYRVDTGETRRIIRDVVQDAEGYWEYRRTVSSLFEALRRVPDLGPKTSGIVEEAREKCERDLFGLHRVIAYPAQALLESVTELERAEAEMVARAESAEGAAHV